MKLKANSTDRYMNHSYLTGKWTKVTYTPSESVEVKSPNASLLLDTCNHFKNTKYISEFKSDLKGAGAELLNKVIAANKDFNLILIPNATKEFDRLRKLAAYNHPKLVALMVTNNKWLIEYYKRFGFKVKGNYMVLKNN